MPRGFRWLVYLSMPFSAVPYYLLALILVYLFALTWSLFPLSGSLTTGSSRGLDWATFLDLAYHAALPVLSVVLAVVGFWALSMRGIMATVLRRGLFDLRAGARPALASHLQPLRDAQPRCCRR